MKSLCIIVALVGFVAFVKADTATESSFDKAVAEALNNIEAGAKKFQEVTGIKTEFDKAKVENFLKHGFGDSRKKIEEILKNLETSAKPFNEEFKKNVDNLSVQFSQTIKSLNNSETQKNIQKLQDAFQTSFKKLVDQANDLAKSTGVTPSPEIQKSLKELVEEVDKSAKAVQNKLQQVISEAQQKKTA